jgi:actin related protein 2/3 complex subunit 4
MVERQVHPEVEFQDNKNLLLAPILHARTEQERTLIEASVNTVRISVSIRKVQEIDFLLTSMLERFMSLRADKFDILRKKPAHEGYDFSFLISDEHLLKYKKEEIMNFILEFIQGMEQEINEMRLGVTNSARFACTFFQSAVANNPLPTK